MCEMKAANPEDCVRIRAVCQSQGFATVKDTVNNHEKLAEYLDDEGHNFPNEEVNLEKWLSDLTPEQGKRICEILEKQE